MLVINFLNTEEIEGFTYHSVTREMSINRLNVHLGQMFYRINPKNICFAQKTPKCKI